MVANIHMPKGKATWNTLEGKANGNIPEGKAKWNCKDFPTVQHHMLHTLKR